jgi:enoyl-CoA hydratase
VAYETIIYERGPLAWITLNRPEKRNAINQKMHDELLHALHAAETDPEVRVIALKGNGPVFSAGHDLYEVAEMFEKGIDYTQLHPSGRSMEEEIWHIRKPTISCVHGFLGPQAIIIATVTDLVVAAEGTGFSLEQARVGGGDIINPLWLSILGLRRHKEWRLTFSILPAEKAVEWGFINKVVPMDQLTKQAEEWAKAMIAVPAQTVNSFKMGLNAMAEVNGAWTLRTFHDAYGRLGHGSERDREFFKMIREQGLQAALRYRDERHGGRMVGHEAEAGAED